MPVGYKTDIFGEAGDADPMMDHKSTLTGGDNGERPPDFLRENFGSA